MLDKIQITAIGGATHSGKSSTVRLITDRLTSTEPVLYGQFSSGMQTREYKNSKIMIFGTYDKTENIQGTEADDLIAREEFVDFIRWFSERHKGYHIIFEGDRLFDSWVFFELATRLASRLDLRIIILTVTEAWQNARIIHTGHKISTAALQAERAKLAGIYRTFRTTGAVRVLPSEDIRQRETNIEIIMAGVISRMYSEGKATTI